MPWHSGILGLAAGVATGFAIAGADVALMILFPALSTVAMTAGAVQLMKHANRNAQHRIAADEFADMKSL